MGPPTSAFQPLLFQEGQDGFRAKLVRRQRPIIIFIFLALFTMTMLAIYNSFSPPNLSSIHIGGISRRNPTSNGDDYFKYSLDSENLDGGGVSRNLLTRIEDLKRIKLSIANEIRDIAKEKAKLLKEKSSLIAKNERLINQISKTKVQLKQVELDLSANKRLRHEKFCDIEQVAPIVFNPSESVDLHRYSIWSETWKENEHSPSIIEQGPRSITLNFTRCPLTKDFKFHLLPDTTDLDVNEMTVLTEDEHDLHHEQSNVKEVLLSHRDYTSNISDACLVISLVREANQISTSKAGIDNHLVINLFARKGTKTLATHQSTMDHPIMVSPTFSAYEFRRGFDIVVPVTLQQPNKYEIILGSLPPLSPAHREYLASYFNSPEDDDESIASTNHTTKTLSNTYKILQTIHHNSIDDLFLFIHNCPNEDQLNCDQDREKLIELSTFVIIITNDAQIIDKTNSKILYQALSKGTVPVIVGESTSLPFDEVIDWRRASIIINTARLPEVHFILRTIGVADLYQMKQHGRRIFERYLVTLKQVLDTTISIIRMNRFKYPPAPIRDLETVLHYKVEPDVDEWPKVDKNCSTKICHDYSLDSAASITLGEVLGPRERPFSSPSYTRNISLALNSAYDLWNNPMHNAHYLYPSSPIDPTTPSEYKFVSSNPTYRPIGDGLGGSGNEFSRALGGDYPNEQFTIVLLTYERETILLKTLLRLKGLPHLNRILIVWNSVRHKPASDIVWPDVGVPIHVVRVGRNSLNNRFLPYDQIQTDAILSLDDDSPLRQDEIVFAFRVWRSSRDRIVGFPARFHGWEREHSSWTYNSNHSCELSMVLTGGAFYHRYYNYIYTYSMAQSIRDVVDRFMNCEDIAMNFLVAHLTRQSPIKVTSRWTFHCPTCTSSLSEDDSHFRERHECLNIFASIYGYTPLLSTQHRADSILFKTRLPRDKQKCFKFV